MKKEFIIKLIDENEFVKEFVINYNNFEIDFSYDIEEKLYYIVLINNDYIFDNLNELIECVKNNC